MLSISDLNSSHQLLDHHRLAKLILKAPSRTLRPTAIVMENSNQALADKMSATRSSSPILESSQGCLFQILGVNAMSNRQCGQTCRKVKIGTQFLSPTRVRVSPHMENIWASLQGRMAKACMRTCDSSITNGCSNLHVPRP